MSNYELRKIAAEDMEKIRVARNAQMDVLRQNQEITPEQQQKYFEEIIKPSFTKNNPELLLYSLFKDQEWIGYGGLVHISWEHKRAEVSFLVTTDRANHPETYAQDFSRFLNLLAHIAFHDLNFNRLFTETFDFRKEHLDILQGFGFKPEGILKEHVLIGNHYHDSLIHGLLAKGYK